MSAWALEWLATSGAVLSWATSQKPFSFMCDRSTRMPSSLHPRTSALPASVDPGPCPANVEKDTARLRRNRRAGSAPDPASAKLGGVKHLQHVQLRVNGFGTLEVDHCREGAVVEAALDLAERTRHAQLTLGFALQTKQDSQLRE